jgi:hypothetical protein
LVDKKGLGFVQSDLIFQGITTLLELAPASRLKRDRLLWFLRASPSTTLDKTFIFYLNSIILVKINFLFSKKSSLNIPFRIRLRQDAPGERINLAF